MDLSRFDRCRFIRAIEICLQHKIKCEPKLPRNLFSITFNWCWNSKRVVEPSQIDASFYEQPSEVYFFFSTNFSSGCLRLSHFFFTSSVCFLDFQLFVDSKWIEESSMKKSFMSKIFQQTNEQHFSPSPFSLHLFRFIRFGLLELILTFHAIWIYKKFEGLKITHISTWMQPVVKFVFSSTQF